MFESSPSVALGGETAQLVGSFAAVVGREQDDTILDRYQIDRAHSGLNLDRMDSDGHSHRRGETKSMEEETRLP